MTNIYMGVSPVSDDTLGIENGVYMRLGSYVADASVVDEASHFPSVYTDGLSSSEGIFITSAGSYVVETSGDATIEIGGSLTQKILSGNSDTTVEAGNVSLTMEDKGFSLTAKDNSKFLVESSHVDGITIEAANGKVSSKGDTIYNHTFGSYLKQVIGSTKKIIKETSTNVSVAWTFPIYLSAAVSAKLCSMSIKIADASETDLKISSGGAKFGVVYLSNNVITHDMGYSVLYFKMRGIQLESAVSKRDLLGWKNIFNVASMDTAMFLTGCTSTVEAHIGIESKMPGT
ncbi:hypothetical protein [Roseibium sp. M-1]